MLFDSIEKNSYKDDKDKLKLLKSIPEHRKEFANLVLSVNCAILHIAKLKGDKLDGWEVVALGRMIIKVFESDTLYKEVEDFIQVSMMRHCTSVRRLTPEKFLKVNIFLSHCAAKMANNDSSFLSFRDKYGDCLVLLFAAEAAEVVKDENINPMEFDNNN